MSTELGYPYNVLSSVFGERVESKANNAKQLSGLIEKLIESLPSEIQRIFLLYAKEGKSYEEISKDEELNADVVKDRIALTLRHLRYPKQSKQLKEFFR